MLSVTGRIETVSQPNGGYVPKSLFRTKSYDDYNEIHEINITLSSIQGMAVDYLTRFIISNNKLKAFDISIQGALRLDEVYENHKEYQNVMALLDGVTGLDRQSIINTCRIVCYDSVRRAGIESYQPAEDVEFSEELYANIPVLVNRCISFLDSVGPVISNELTFEGGYTTLVSSGDGDYATKDMIIDIKVSKNEFSAKWSLQLLMYYLLGIHSEHPEYKEIRRLCIFNPYENHSYICEIADISDESKYKVSHDVLGYKMAVGYRRFDEHFREYEDYSSWHDVDGSDIEVAKQFFTAQFIKTDFDVESYDDGIFDISVDDYWTYLSTNFEEYKKALRPLFRNTKSVKFIKNNQYYMFVSVSNKGRYSLLHGARLHALEYPLEYYYENLERYAVAIVTHFSKYWDALRILSEQLKSMEPTEKYLRKQYSEYLGFQKLLYGKNKSDCLSYDGWYHEYGYECKMSGKIHGCIVDIDWSNHIYVNPYDGSVVPYSAASMYDKNVYKNTKSLLSAQRPEMIPAFDKLIEEKKSDTTLITQNKDALNEMLVPQDDSISKAFVKVYDYDMYCISNKLKPLQNIYDMKLIQIWYDEILNDKKALIGNKYDVKTKKKTTKPSYIGQTKLQKNGMSATVIRYGNRNDADVQFEDGTVVEHIRIIKWEIGNVRYPKMIEEKKPPLPQKRTKNKYIGLTKMMNCGLQATVIDYKDCKNVTIQFEDGVIKEGVRSDHFMCGKVRHP